MKKFVLDFYEDCDENNWVSYSVFSVFAVTTVVVGLSAIVLINLFW